MCGKLTLFHILAYKQTYLLCTTRTRALQFVVMAMVIFAGKTFVQTATAGGVMLRI